MVRVTAKLSPIRSKSACATNPNGTASWKNNGFQRFWSVPEQGTSQTPMRFCRFARMAVTLRAHIMFTAQSQPTYVRLMKVSDPTS